MKWLGQYIQSFTARFRDDVYLENLSTTTGTDSLVVDSDGKISKNTSIGGDITSLGTLNALTVTSASDLGSAAIRLTNQDVDQYALSISANNTTAAVLPIFATALTTGAGLYMNIDDTLTASATKSLIDIDYDKTGITGEEQTSDTTGLNISMEDSVTNVGTVNQTGINVNMDFDNAGGTLVQKGIVLGVGADDVGDSETAVGIEMEVIDGGTDIKIMSSSDTADYCAITTTTNGATTITTVDGGAAAGHFEVAADGNITLDAAGDIALEAGGNDVTIDADTVTVTSSTASKPLVQIRNETVNQGSGALEFYKDRGVAALNNDDMGMISFIGENDAQETIYYGNIIVEAKEVDDGDECGRMQFQIAESDGSTGSDLTTGLKIVGADNSTDGEVNVTIAAGAASTTTIAGTLTMGSTAAMTNAGLVSVANQSNITGVGTITSGVWRGTAITADYIADNKGSKHFGTKIKILPSDFLPNEDGGTSKGMFMDDTAPTGLKPGIAQMELVAFASIPEGMDATHVDVYGAQDLAIEVFEMNINASGLTSKGSGNANTTLDITDFSATATNYLAIIVTTTATSDRVWGADVTIAAS